MRDKRTTGAQFRAGDAVAGSVWRAGEETSTRPVCDSDPALLSFALYTGVVHFCTISAGSYQWQ